MRYLFCARCGERYPQTRKQIQEAGSKMHCSRECAERDGYDPRQLEIPLGLSKPTGTNEEKL